MAPTETTLAVRSGKAAVLCELQRAGFDVPAFEVSPSNLAATVQRLGLPLAVRSSASLEDGERHSFAGQLHSFLNLQSLEEVEQAVQQCMAAIDAPEVIEYCAKHRIPRADLQIDTIVQRMVKPELAGVVFTLDPVRGTEEPVINACEGLADELLAGRRAPLTRDHPLMRRYETQIIDTARRIEGHFGAPQDIEFAVCEGKVLTLQSRPITRLGFAGIEGQWTNANFREGGVSSGACSPLMWSLYELIWNAALKRTLRETRLWRGDFAAARLFFGRPYWNLEALKRSVALVPGYVEREFDEDVGVALQYEGPGTTTKLTLRTALRAIPIVCGVKSFLRRQERAAHGLLDNGLGKILTRYVNADAEQTFSQLIEEDYFALETTYFRTVFAVSLIKLDFKLAFPQCDYATLVGSLPPLRHMAARRRMQEMAQRGEVAAVDLLRDFPHYSRWGLDVRFPRWDEEPELFSDLLQQSSHEANSNGSSSRARFEEAREQALRSVSRLRRSTFLRRLERLRNYVWLREEVRDLSTRMYHLIRRQVLEIARRRRLGDDIFLMTYREIADDDRSKIEERRTDFRRFLNFRAPNEIGERWVNVDKPAAEGLQGIPTSAGSVRGVAYLARTMAEASRLPAGCILVCPFIEPNWTPVLGRFVGIVTETGGQLSHAAVLCREYGIPAVLNVPDVMQLIRGGTTITLHGATGRIEIDD